MEAVALQIETVVFVIKDKAGGLILSREQMLITTLCLLSDHDARSVKNALLKTSIMAWNLKDLCPMHVPYHDLLSQKRRQSAHK